MNLNKTVEISDNIRVQCESRQQAELVADFLSNDLNYPVTKFKDRFLVDTGKFSFNIIVVDNIKSPSIRELNHVQS